VIELRTEWVLEMMERLDWNPARLARRTGVDQAAVYRLLRGDQQLGMSSLPGLLLAFREVFPDSTLDHLFARLFYLYDYDDERGCYVDVTDVAARSGQSGPPRRPSGGPRRAVVGEREDSPGDVHEAREEADVPALTP
jgi:hypothetical protein